MNERVRSRPAQNRITTLTIRIERVAYGRRLTAPYSFAPIFAPGRLGLSGRFEDETHGGAMRRPTVLVVDDDAFSRAVVSRKVAKLADVVEVEDGLEAMAQMKTIV